MNIFPSFACNFQCKFCHISKMDKGELTVRLEYPADSSLEASAETTLRLAESIRELKDSEGEPLARDMAITVGKTQGILGQVTQ